MKLTIIFLVLISVCFAEKTFQEFKKLHKKSYKDKDAEDKALKHYTANCEACRKHNELHKAGKVGFDCSCEYEDSDRDTNEVIAEKCRTMVPHTARALPGITYANAGSLPKTTLSAIDWTSKCGPVKNQGNCGSCWAFATQSQHECRANIVNKVLPLPQSTQYLVDCSKNGNNGCSGGWPSNAMDFIVTSGSVYEQNYPYKAVNGVCGNNFIPYYSGLTKVNQYNLDRTDTYLKNLVAFQGPVVVAVRVTDLFYSYKSGIFFDSMGTNTNCISHVNHAVLVVGFGTANGVDYWKVQNSWGNGWGEAGFIRILRNGSPTLGRNNTALIACWGMGLY